jgi:hypothetical protein
MKRAAIYTRVSTVDLGKDPALAASRVLRPARLAPGTHRVDVHSRELLRGKVPRSLMTWRPVPARSSGAVSRKRCFMSDVEALIFPYSSLSLNLIVRLFIW